VSPSESNHDRAAKAEAAEVSAEEVEARVASCVSKHGHAPAHCRKKHAHVHLGGAAAAAAAAAAARNTVELVVLAPSAVHGFREPYVTLPRSLEARALLEEFFVPAGFRLLDATATELARPEMAADGLHYNDAMNYMHAQLLLNMLCNDDRGGGAEG
jgi:hypothetical protein